MHVPFLREVRDLFNGEGRAFAARKDDGGVSTSVSVVYVTAKKTFTGPAVYITQVAPSKTPQPQNAATPTPQSPPGPKDTPAAPSNPPPSTKAPVSTSQNQESTPTRKHSSSAQETSSAPETGTPATPSAAIVTQPSSSNPSSTLNPLAAGASSSSTTSSPDAQKSTSSGGMSPGGKAGLAIGILLGLAALLALALFFYRRRKAMTENHERLDDEKGQLNNNNPNNEFPMTAAVGAAQATPRPRKSVKSFAPRLSLRPVTQFLPGLGSSDRRSNGNMLDVPDSGPSAGVIMSGGAGAAAGAAAGGARGLRQPGASAAQADPTAASAWEKVGQRDHANDPDNPFGNHAETVAHSPPRQGDLSTAPGSPTKTDILSSAADAAPAAVAGAAIGATVGAAASHSKEPSKDGSIVPKPLSIKSNKSAVSLATPGSPVKSEVSNNASTTSVPASLVAGGAGAGAAAPAAGANNVHRVQMDFKPSMEDELELRSGQLVRMLHEYDDGWALCIRMDRSHQGVVPRTCLSKHTVKPRPPPNQNSPRGPPRGPPPNGPMGPPRAMTPTGGRNSPGPGAGPRPMGPPSGRSSPSMYGPQGHPMTPTGRNSPGPGSRPMTPTGAGGFPAAPFGNPSRPGPPMTPGGRARSGSVPRSMSPGPYGAGGPRMMAPEHRRRSNSMSQLVSPNATGSRRNSPPGGSPLSQGSMLPVPSRKPVPGQAM